MRVAKTSKGSGSSFVSSRKAIELYVWKAMIRIDSNSQYPYTNRDLMSSLKGFIRHVIKGAPPQDTSINICYMGSTDLCAKIALEILIDAENYKVAYFNAGYVSSSLLSTLRTKFSVINWLPHPL